VDDAHTANLLGALALVVHDRFGEAMTEASGRSQTAAAALASLDNFLDRPTIDTLRRVLGLTSSGTVRLVDRLQDDGLVERSQGDDRRATALQLTRTGRKAARDVAGARAAVLDDALASLAEHERETLDGLLAKLLVGMMREPGATRYMCRLCDASACGHAEGRCPVRNAARERFAT
jgi:DNA-binding MarR family transcriptional regulator